MPRSTTMIGLHHEQDTTHLYSQTESPMSSQSFTTPAMFIVNADVFPISRKTAMFSAAVTQA
jgi:hypothetical protein